MTEENHIFYLHYADLVIITKNNPTDSQVWYESIKWFLLDHTCNKIRMWTQKNVEDRTTYSGKFSYAVRTFHTSRTGAFTVILAKTHLWAPSCSFMHTYHKIRQNFNALPLMAKNPISNDISLVNYQHAIKSSKMDLIYHARPINSAYISIYTPFANQFRSRWWKHTVNTRSGRCFFKFTRRSINCPTTEVIKLRRSRWWLQVLNREFSRTTTLIFQINLFSSTSQGTKIYRKIWPYNLFKKYSREVKSWYHINFIQQNCTRGPDSRQKQNRAY